MVKGQGTLEHPEIPLRMREAAGLMVLGCALWDGMEPFLDQVDKVRKVGQESIPYSDQLKRVWQWNDTLEIVIPTSSMKGDKCHE